MMIGTYVLLISQLFCVQSLVDHYWKDYDGTIPSDAIPADDNDDSKRYIGQVYIDSFGLWVGTIIPGSKEVYVPYTGAWKTKKTDVMIKILCAQDHSNFIWFKTTPDTITRDMEGQSPIVGGNFSVANKTGVINIGRTRLNDHSVIGSVTGAHTGFGWFFYNLNGNLGVVTKTAYEVLVYRDAPDGCKKWATL